MAYDDYLVERIRNVLKEKAINFSDKKMMGGRIFMMDNKMLCGTHIDKKYGDSLLMVRIGEEAYKNNMHKTECLPMDFTGRPMKGYIFVNPDGLDTEEDLSFWLQLAIDFNPFAKSSKK